MSNPAILSWLLDAATLIGLALLAGSGVYGLLLVIRPAFALRASERLNRRYSSRRALRPLEIPRRSERFFYRHHRIIGTALLAAVAAFLSLYFLEFPRNTVIASLGRQFGSGPLGEVVLQAMERFFLLANVLTGSLALVMIIRPSLLKPLEAWANRWISTRRTFRAADTAFDSLDRLTARAPRTVGLLILAGTIFVTLGLLVAAGGGKAGA